MFRSETVQTSHFYPRPPCGGRPFTRLASMVPPCISIHVPLAGDDGPVLGAGLSTTAFLSTSPLRGTTKSSGPMCRGSLYFYPRPPCGGRRSTPSTCRQSPNFYPRPPCGGRPAAPLRAPRSSAISIHVPLAGDDSVAGMQSSSWIKISIHVPLAGDDSTWWNPDRTAAVFLSTSPLRGTTRRAVGLAPPQKFLSTSPLRGTTVSLSAALLSA